MDLKFYHFVKPSYFFLLTKEFGLFWKKPFCVSHLVIGGNREDLEFAEKSIGLGI